jgi:hypothetical protein
MYAFSHFGVEWIFQGKKVQIFNKQVGILAVEHGEILFQARCTEYRMHLLYFSGTK